ncbi:MAG: dodecin domain-containing protein [Planctomycetales bacterium]|nr:dodecin domain-containing protein [Planctomycetales bacterium]
MSLVKVIELVASSPSSWEDAVQVAIADASKTLRHISGVDVIKHSAHVKGGKVAEYRATVHIAFVVDEANVLTGAK